MTGDNKQVWQQEWAAGSMRTVPSHGAETPSDEVVLFRSYLGEKGVQPGSRVVDIGMGKGRNGLYLAREGFNVVGFDYIPAAVDYAAQVAVRESLDENTEFLVADVAETWPFQDESFDVAIDSLTTVGLRHEARKKCRDEMHRVLKRGGLALVRLVSAEDELEQELMQAYPGGEPNSSIWPGIGKFQKNFTREEVTELYSTFDILELDKRQKKATKAGREFTATNWWLVVQKP